MGSRAFSLFLRMESVGGRGERQGGKRGREIAVWKMFVNKQKICVPEDEVIIEYCA